MGSAIECFDDADAVVVPRSRFAPVKTCNDLFALRSGARSDLQPATARLQQLVAPVCTVVSYKMCTRLATTCC